MKLTHKSNKNDNGEKIRHLDGSCECAFEGIKKEL